MKIAVIALGKIGLPLAVQFANKGHEVVGVDVNPTVVDLVKWDARTADDDDRLLPDHVEEDDQRSA